MSSKLSDIVSAAEHYRQDQEAGARACVEEGGGIWGGIQDCDGLQTDLVLFTSKKTGSTYALKVTEITPEGVQEHTKKMDAKFEERMKRFTVEAFNDGHIAFTTHSRVEGGGNAHDRRVPTEKPIAKCEHGIYVVPGETAARYCTGCVPGSSRIIAGLHTEHEILRPERVIDAADYISQPVWERLAEAERMESL